MFFGIKILLINNHELIDLQHLNENGANKFYLF